MVGMHRSPQMPGWLGTGRYVGRGACHGSEHRHDASEESAESIYRTLTVGRCVGCVGRAEKGRNVPQALGYDVVEAAYLARRCNDMLLERNVRAECMTHRERLHRGSSPT